MIKEAEQLGIPISKYVKMVMKNNEACLIRPHNNETEVFTSSHQPINSVSLQFNSKSKKNPSQIIHDN